jgi:hypothetical protein
MPDCPDLASSDRPIQTAYPWIAAPNIPARLILATMAPPMGYSVTFPAMQV